MRLVASFLCRYHHVGFYQSIYEISWLQTLLFYKTEDIIAEFKQYLKDSDKFDIVTVVGEGEPTLASNLGELVDALKALTDKPVAVITNGALLSDPQVREELCHADMVLPSLDAHHH